jgi:hypothetical protein
MPPLRIVPALGLLGTLLGFAPVVGQSGRSSDVGLDHVILGIDNLDRGIEQFAARTGVTPVRGGQHPGRGTENALASLGDGRYLELLAPVASGARGAPDERTQHPDLTFSGWALHTHALADVVARLRAAGATVDGPTPGSRRTPDGTLLQWRTAAVSGPGLELAPFLIEWATGTAHPSVSAPGGCRFVSVDLAMPDPAPLQKFFAAVGYTANVQTGARAMRVTLECPKGRVTFDGSGQ